MTIAAVVSVLDFASSALARTILPVDAPNHCSTALLWPLGIVVLGGAIGVLLTLDPHVLRQFLSLDGSNFDRRGRKRSRKRNAWGR